MKKYAKYYLCWYNVFIFVHGFPRGRAHISIIAIGMLAQRTSNGFVFIIAGTAKAECKRNAFDVRGSMRPRGKVASAQHVDVPQSCSLAYLSPMTTGTRRWPDRMSQVEAKSAQPLASNVSLTSLSAAARELHKKRKV